MTFKALLFKNSFLIIISILFLTSCSLREKEEKKRPIPSTDLPTITIGAKSLTEQYILMTMTSILLRDRGYSVNEIRFLDSPAIRSAIEEQVIDLYWEYTNTARMYYHKYPPIYDPYEAFDTVKKEDERKNIIWLENSHFNSSWGIMVKKGLAKQHQLKTVSDLIEYMKKSNHQLKFATNEEFLIREDGLNHLEKVYEFTLSENQLLAIESDLLTLAVREERVDVSIGMVSDSRISEYGLLLLEDDQKAFPPYNAAPVVTKKIIENYPDIQSILVKLSKSITHQEMIQLNYQVDVLHIEETKVAKVFLEEKGLIN
ncbi:glycine betaine ABC transporter substrate-binding protein [Metabacillus herbersteinensis]|uniref:Glycine betaine ABC transporter substrate-binding protein n=1 Tax=Metabacillus herbersteinensis TaxID=283816 RepID=A0ABV6GHW9_9BACI